MSSHDSSPLIFDWAEFGPERFCVRQRVEINEVLAVVGRARVKR